MSLMYLISRFLSKLILRPSVPAFQKVSSRPRSILRQLKVVPGMVTTALCFLPLTDPALAAFPAEETGKGTIVAAGFGYQIGELSTITVKVYDARSGSVISDDTFELHVKEDKGVQGGIPQARIFAGGVGLGATDLSNFILRVYDAQTGKFQWEGQLNLTPSVDGASGQAVSTLMPRRALVTKISASTATTRQPSFLLRALDSSTGNLVWQDEFSTGDMRAAAIERITNRFSYDEQMFDFRIRMFDVSGRSVLWEDHWLQEQPEDDSHQATDDQAHILPVWPRLVEQDQLSQEL